ncbi:PIN domain nuclease [Antribacter gilvus]|uniref:PIN domain nuclease n=1 Tax=Antribacter gilvus TaxID=2304675 RepID=UPI000F777EFF|nr:PIN domain nuclease [Antribacter gilvus]
MAGIVYDTGALLAAERRDVRFLAMHAEFLRAGVHPVVPVVVLAQAWRGGPQDGISRLLKGCQVRADDERTGRTAGVVCGMAGSSDVVDALVVTTAALLGAVVVTSDPDDIGRLSDALGGALELVTV